VQLEKLQAALARLSVDADLRALARENPRQAAAALGLALEELQQIARTAGLPGFAASLVSKRLGQVRLLLPRTAAALGEEFDLRFRAYAASRPVAGVKKHQRDAIAFAAELGDADEPAWLADLAAYEAAWVEAIMGRRLLVRRLGWRMSHEPPSKGLCWAVWLRLPASGLRHFAWP